MARPKQMMKKKTCLRCGCDSLYTVNLTSSTYFTFRLNDENAPDKLIKNYCPYYDKSEICHNAYYYNHYVDDMFKDAYSCCNCSHRILTPDGEPTCFYDYLDYDAKKMYYLEPLTKNSENTILVKAKYWTCPICKTVHTISLKEYKYIPKNIRKE